MPICKLCQQTKPLVDAHIIPKSMYPLDKGPEKYLFMTVTGNDPRRTISHTGEYDSELVCGSCEASFSPWDDYAYRLFNKSLDWQLLARTAAGVPRCWIHRGSDYAKLRLFALSVLWRAHASTRPAFKSFSLGLHAERFARMIRSGIPGPPGHFPCFLVRLDPTDNLSSAVLIPMLSLMGRCRIAEFTCGGFRVMVALTSSRVPRNIADMALRPNKVLHALGMNFRELHAYQPVLKSVRALDLKRRVSGNTKKRR